MIGKLHAVVMDSTDPRGQVFRDPSGHPFCLVFDVVPD